MYSRISNLVLGFHGCDRSVGIKILHSNGTLHLEKSYNDYDWLGNGIYFWENNPERALKFARDAIINKRLTKGEITEPFVIGAVIDLGHCLNLLDTLFLKELKKTYELMKTIKVPGKKSLITDGMTLSESQKLGVDTEEHINTCNTYEMHSKLSTQLLGKEFVTNVIDLVVLVYLPLK